METLDKLYLYLAAQSIGPLRKEPLEERYEGIPMNELFDRLIVGLMVTIALVLAAPLGVVLAYQGRPAEQAPQSAQIAPARPRHRAVRPAESLPAAPEFKT